MVLCVFFLLLEKQNQLNVKGISFKSTMPHLNFCIFAPFIFKMSRNGVGAAAAVTEGQGSKYISQLIIGLCSSCFSPKHMATLYKMSHRPVRVQVFVFCFFAGFCLCQLLSKSSESLDLSFTQGSQGA